MDRAAGDMRKFWDSRARENAAWYVDTTCDYEHPDMEAFFRTGERIVAEALTAAPVQPCGYGLAVEIGPGLGRVCLALAGHFERVVGVDVSEEMVTRARQLVSDDRITFEVGSGMDLRSVPSATADFVVTFTVLQHLSDPELIEAYLRDSARVLKPGGVLAAQWNNSPRPGIWKLRVGWWRLRNVVGGRASTDIRNSPEFAGTRMPYDRVRATLEASGMAVRATKGLGSLFAWVWAEKLP
jgi:SAM-dependent methyltransferase